MSTTKTHMMRTIRLAGLVHGFATCVGVAALALPPTEARAEDAAQKTLWVETEDANGTQTSTAEITIHPAAEPRPALRYRLLPAEEDLVDGNAAIHYLKAMGFLGQDYAHRRIDELRTKANEEEAKDGKRLQCQDGMCEPPDWPPGYNARAAALPLPEVREFLALHWFQVPLLTEAARRRHCDWDRRIAELDNPYAYLVTEIQESRSLARVESLRCRLAITEGRIDDGLAVLRRQFMLARHLQQDEFAVGVHNGVSVALTATSDALELAQLPAAPNLYWACAAMPRPFVDVSRMLATERSWLYLVMKSLRDVDETPRPVEYWQAFIDRDLRSLAPAIPHFDGDSGDRIPSFSGDWGFGNYEPDDPSFHEPKEIFRLRAATFIAAAYPGARRYLAEECGLPAERLDALPTSQVVFLAMRRFYDTSNDELAKWEATPYWIAAPKLAAARDKIEADAKRIGPSAATACFFATDVVDHRSALARLDQQLAILQTVEALRLHAAVRGGLPESLADLPVPAPLDPATGRPIAYSVTGNRALLEPEQTSAGWRHRVIVHLAPPTPAPSP
jgi:hypothetical protein